MHVLRMCVLCMCMCMCCVCAVHVLCMCCVCTVHVLCMCCACAVCVLCMCCVCAVCVSCISCVYFLVAELARLPTSACTYDNPIPSMNRITADLICHGILSAVYSRWTCRLGLMDTAVRGIVVSNCVCLHPGVVRLPCLHWLPGAIP